MAGVAVDWKALAVILSVVLLASPVWAIYPTCLTTKICDAPNNMDKESVPQVVLFTYSGSVNAMTRRLLDKIFPSTFTNPNGCPIGITTFVISQDADPCSVRLIQARGHEIALSGERRTSRVDNWNFDRWNESIVGQQKNIANRSAIDEADIVGMRAQHFRPGNNSQFKMLNVNSFVYDSSLLVKQVEDSDVGHYWPFEMTAEVLEKLSCQSDCPNETFKGLWQIPAARLFQQIGEDLMSCVYLDQCLGDTPTAEQVYRLLRDNYVQVLDDNRAPLQINLRERFIDSPAIVTGIQRFIANPGSSMRPWFITMHDLMQWMKNPVEKNYLTKGYWLCRFRSGVQCAEQMTNNTIKRVTFATIINVEHIWLWQTIFLIVTYIVIYRYDKYMQENKNK